MDIFHGYQSFQKMMIQDPAFSGQAGIIFPRYWTSGWFWQFFFFYFKNKHFHIPWMALHMFHHSSRSHNFRQDDVQKTKKTHHLKILQCILSYPPKKKQQQKTGASKRRGSPCFQKKKLRWFKIDLFHPLKRSPFGVNSPPQKVTQKTWRGTRNIQKLNGVSVGIIKVPCMFFGIWIHKKEISFHPYKYEKKSPYFAGFIKIPSSDPWDCMVRYIYLHEIPSKNSTEFM